MSSLTILTIIIFLVLIIIVSYLLMSHFDVMRKIFTGGSTIPFDKLQTIAILGMGAIGSVYKVQYDDKFYALKREKIVKQKIKKIPNAIKIHSILYKNPEARKYFIDIIDYRIIKCNYKHKLPQYLKNLAK